MEIDEAPFRSVYGRAPARDEYGNFVFAKAPMVAAGQSPEDEIIVSFMIYSEARQEAMRIARARRWCQERIYLITAMSFSQPYHHSQTDGDGDSGP